MLRGHVTEERGAVFLVFNAEMYFVTGLAKLEALPGVQAEVDVDDLRSQYITTTRTKKTKKLETQYRADSIAVRAGAFEVLAFDSSSLGLLRALFAGMILLPAPTLSAVNMTQAG